MQFLEFCTYWWYLRTSALYRFLIYTFKEASCTFSLCSLFQDPVPRLMAPIPAGIFYFSTFSLSTLFGCLCYKVILVLVVIQSKIPKKIVQHCVVRLLHLLMLEKQKTEVKYYATYKYLQMIFRSWVCVLKVSSIQLRIISCHIILFFENLHLSNWVLPILNSIVYWKWPLKTSYLLASAVGDLELTNSGLHGFPSEKRTFTSTVKKS